MDFPPEKFERRLVGHADPLGCEHCIHGVKQRDGSDQGVMSERSHQRPAEQVAGLKVVAIVSHEPAKVLFEAYGMLRATCEVWHFFAFLVVGAHHPGSRLSQDDERLGDARKPRAPWAAHSLATNSSLRSKHLSGGVDLWTAWSSHPVNRQVGMLVAVVDQIGALSVGAR